MINLDRLSDYLKRSNANTITLSFAEIESILESDLPDEAKRTAKWWWNISGSKKAKSWLDYGYYTYDNKNMLGRGGVCFIRNVKKPELQRGLSRVWYFLTDRDAELHQKTMAVLEISVIPFATILSIIYTILNFYSPMYPANSQVQNQTDYENLVSEGDYALDNKNFLDAASYYHRAFLNAYDIHSEAYSLHREGSCYMLYGVEESDKDYLKRALVMYERILNTPEYENTEGFQETIIDICSLYWFLGYDWQNEKWCSVVEQLETIYDFDDYEKISEKDVETLISVAINLSLYYETVLSSNITTFIYSEDYHQKVIYYLKIATQLQRISNKYYGVNLYDETLAFTIYSLTSYIIANEIDNPHENYLEILEVARNLCQDVISTMDLDAKNMIQLNVYIKLKTNIGKSYIISSYAVQSPDKEEYMLKAYQELISLLYWDDYEVSESIMYASSYILLTNLCTENDIKLLLDDLSSRMQIARENNDIEMLIQMEFSGLRMCSTILLSYDYESSRTSATKYGQQLWEDLNTVLFDFLDSSQKTELDEYSEQFGT